MTEAPLGNIAHLPVFTSVRGDSIGQTMWRQHQQGRPYRVPIPEDTPGVLPAVKQLILNMVKLQPRDRMAMEEVEQQILQLQSELELNHFK